MAKLGSMATRPHIANQKPEVPGLFFGRVMMNRGNRTSQGNDDSNSVHDLMHLLTMMELNRKYRQKNQGSHEERLRGLFGGSRK